MPRIEEKQLKGLRFHTSEKREITKDGEKKTRYFPVERDLKPGDILSSRSTPEGTVIVTKDGRKYTLGKGDK